MKPFVALFLAVAFSCTAAAEEVQLDAVADAVLYEDATGTSANGSGQYLVAGKTRRFGLRRTVIQFDLSSVPAGATIDSAVLRLTLSQANGTGSYLVSLLRTLTNWAEGPADPADPEGLGTDASAGDTTWIHRSYESTNWDAAGGDFAFSPSAQSTVDPVFTNYTWSGSGMVADVQSWLDDPAGNFGWFLIGDEGVEGSALRFNSRTHPDAATRPLLTVTYTVAPVPEPATLTMLALGGLALVQRRCRA
jgi:hypothetical protein